MENSKHSDITDSTCCLILNQWYSAIPRDILLVITTFAYNAHTVYNDIVALVKEYQDKWQPLSFIDEPYILGANNTTQPVLKDSEEEEVQMFSDCSDDSSNNSDDALSEKRVNRIDMLLEQMPEQSTLQEIERKKWQYDKKKRMEANGGVDPWDNYNPYWLEDELMQLVDDISEPENFLFSESD